MGEHYLDKKNLSVIFNVKIIFLCILFGCKNLIWPFNRWCLLTVQVRFLTILTIFKLYIAEQVYIWEVLQASMTPHFFIFTSDDQVKD